MNKLVRLVPVVLFTLAISVFTGCGGDGGSKNNNDNKEQQPQETYSVSFNTTGGSSVTARSVKPGESISEPDSPTRAGYNFVGWYASSDFSGSPVPFPYTPTGNITLYAKWEQQNDVSITIAPPTATANVGESKAFTVRVENTQNTGFDVSIDPPTGLTCPKTAFGINCTATAADTYTITVTSADAGKTSKAVLTVKQGTTPIDNRVPKNVSATLYAGMMPIISWSSVSGADSYMVERDGKVATFREPYSPFLDIGASPNTTHTYVVYALFDNYNPDDPRLFVMGPPSSPVSVTTGNF